MTEFFLALIAGELVIICIKLYDIVEDLTVSAFMLEGISNSFQHGLDRSAIRNGWSRVLAVLVTQFCL